MPHDLVLRLGDRIGKLRKTRGWTQAEMAERVGIDRSFLADVERGKRNVSILNLESSSRIGNLPLAIVFTTLRGASASLLTQNGVRNQVYNFPPVFLLILPLEDPRQALGEEKAQNPRLR